MGKAPASSKGMPSLTANVSASFATACPASPPQANLAMTRSPGQKRVTAGPHRASIPAVSRPGLNGKGGRVW